MRNRKTTILEIKVDAETPEQCNMKTKELIKKTIIVTITAILTIILLGFLMRMCVVRNAVKIEHNDEMLKSEFRE